MMIHRILFYYSLVVLSQLVMSLSSSTAGART